MKAKDLMIPIQDYLRPDNTLKEAVNLLRIAKKGEEKVGSRDCRSLTRRESLSGCSQ